MMPGMDGYEVCKHLKSHAATANIPVLFVSSRDEEEDGARGLSLGAIDYIVKPIRPSIVQARVRNHLDLKRSRDLLQRLTTQDHLTGISNRRRFDDFLDMEWRRAAREQAPISLIAIDIDHFKAYNDHYGHPGGDQCLIEVARTLATCVTRPCDLVARCGGEEFACVLPSTDSAGAASLAEQIRLGILAQALEHAQSGTHACHHQPGRGHRGTTSRRVAPGVGGSGRRCALKPRARGVTAVLKAR
jgi:diguanylate cyclase (GGDEF)-like protein